jgi:hypothetical protein
MYWNNPLIEIFYPSDRDPVQESLHNNNHCIFYNPTVDKNKIRSNQNLSDLCNWINQKIIQQGMAGFLTDTQNHYEIANLVKLNMWVDDLPRNGSIKPMLLQYIGNEKYETGTGESRLRALERVASISTVHAFISTHSCYLTQFDHLESITTFTRFAELCQADVGQQFLFRLTDKDAPYGLDWYEYNSSQTTQITPGQDYCVTAIKNYLKEYPTIVFTPEWFDTLINWDDYKN